MIVYLDSSAIVKRYVLENGSDKVAEVYEAALTGEAKIAFSSWNIGEVLGVLDKYHRRGQLSEQDYRLARRQFVGETLRLIRLRIVKIVPVKTSLLVLAWRLIETEHIYEADALQIVSAKYIKATNFLTGDKRLHKVALSEGIPSVYLG